MLDVSDVLNKANMTYSYPSKFRVRHLREDQYSLSFEIPVNAKLAIKCTGNYQTEHVNDGSRDYYTTMLKEVIEVFNQMEYRDKVLSDLQQWGHAYLNVIRDKIDKTSNVKYGSKQSRFEELNTVLNNIDSTLRSSDLSTASILDVELDMTNRIKISTGYNSSEYSEKLGRYISDNGVIEIPYEIADTVEYYNELLSELHECIKKVGGDYNVYDLYISWERSFIKEMHAVTGLKLKPYSRASK